MSLLSIQKLTRRYGGLLAINDVSFDLQAGEMLGIMGANGAGKTTLFSLIAGNVAPSSGTIHLDGVALHGRKPEQVNEMGVARTFQIVRPFPSMTVLENVVLGRLYGRSQTKSMNDAKRFGLDLLAEVGLANRADTPASSLNLAGRKRLEIARALATKPRILMLDEVLAGLNATEVDAALDLIQEVRARHGLAIMIIEHVMKALMRVSERIVVLHDGRKLMEGAPADVANDPRVIKAYLGERRRDRAA